MHQRHLTWMQGVGTALAGHAPVGIGIKDAVVIRAGEGALRHVLSKQVLHQTSLWHEGHAEEKIDSPGLTDVVSVSGHDLLLIAR